MKLYIWIILLLLAGCAQPSGDRIQDGDAPVSVKVITVSRDTVYEPVIVSGTFTTDDEAIRSFKTGGIIQRIFVGEGDAVREGQVLATLDMTEISAQVNQATLAFEKARRDYQRVTNLYNDSVVTREMYENAGTALHLAETQLTAARFNLTHSEIRASENGFILRKFVNEGQVVGPGTPVFQTNGAGSGDWLLRVSVSDGQWSALKPGDNASIRTGIPGSREIPARVTRKSEGVDPVSGTFTLDLKPVGKPEITIASGMFGKAEIKPSAGRIVWKIPYQALLDGNGSEGFVFVACNGKKAEKRTVSVAGLNREYVLVDKGLEECNRVIVTGSAYLNDQSDILIIP